MATETFFFCGIRAFGDLIKELLPKNENLKLLDVISRLEEDKVSLDEFLKVVQALLDTALGKIFSDEYKRFILMKQL
ncbi:MAG: hypothetical protein ACTSSI_15485, partial [Candidatus Helarchaeota archaeon]